MLCDLLMIHPSGVLRSRCRHGVLFAWVNLLRFRLRCTEGSRVEEHRILSCSANSPRMLRGSARRAKNVCKEEQKVASIDQKHKKPFAKTIVITHSFSGDVVLLTE